jgi:hypothetical protein
MKHEDNMTKDQEETPGKERHTKGRRISLKQRYLEELMHYDYN